jgi:protein-disulfide isomerase
VNTGKAKLVVRNFPLDFHAGAKPAAQAVECAADQGKYWELQDKIFQEQDKQGQGTIQFTKADVLKWAGAIGLNITTLTQCMDSGKYDKKITNDLASGQANGVSGTPTTFINGQKIVGAVPFETFKAAIDQLLK